MKQNRIIAGVVLAFVIWWMYLTLNLPKTTMIGTSEPGPKFFPMILLIGMALLAIALFFVKPKEKEKMEDLVMEDGEVIEVKEEETHPMRKALALFGVFFIGIVLIYFVGFLIGVIACATVMLWMIGWKLFPRALVFSAIVTLVVYFLFDWALKVPLPKGILF